MGHLHVFISYLLMNLNSPMITSVSSLWQKQNRWYDLYCKERQTEAPRFFKTCPRALELVSGTRAGTRSLMSDFILVCPFQNSSSAFCHMCKLYHLFYERPIHSFPISNVPFIKAYFVVWCFLQSLAQSSWKSFCRLVSFTITPYRKS